MRSRKKLFFIFLAVVLVMISCVGWSVFSAKSDREQVLLLLQRYDGQRLSPSNTVAMEILGRIENPYPYVLEVCGLEDGSLRKLFITKYDHLPEFVTNAVAKPYPAPIRQSNALEMLGELSLIDDDLSQIFPVLQHTNKLAHKAVWKSLLKRVDTSKAWPYENLFQQATNTMPVVREFVVEVLEKFARNDKNAGLYLARLSEGQDEVVAFKSACAIVRAGGDSQAAAPVFERILISQNFERQSHAAYLMLFISRQHPGIAPAFMKAASSTNSSIRAISLSHLPYCGLAARPFMSQIQTYLHDEDYGVRYAATNAIRRIEFSAQAEGEIPLGQPLRFPTERSVIHQIRNEL